MTVEPGLSIRIGYACRDHFSSVASKPPGAYISSGDPEPKTS